jgi:hypothetical protein
VIDPVIGFAGAGAAATLAGSAAVYQGRLGSLSGRIAAVVTFGNPIRWSGEDPLHLRAVRRRCQRRTVPGVTSRCARSLAGRSRISVARTARSAQSSRGRGFARRRTATSCRSTSSSASLEADDRPSRTSQPQTRTNMRQSRRRDTDGHDAVRLARPSSQVTGHADFWHPTGAQPARERKHRSSAAHAPDQPRSAATALPARAGPGPAISPQSPPPSPAGPPAPSAVHGDTIQPAPDPNDDTQSDST